MPGIKPITRRNRQGLMILLALVFSLFILLVILAADRGLGPQLFRFVYWLPGGDLLGHFVLIGTLNLLVNLALAGRQAELAGRKLLAGSLVIAGLVTVEELLQLWLITRTFSLSDLAADYMALLVSSYLALRLLRWLDRLEPRTKN